MFILKKKSMLLILVAGMLLVALSMSVLGQDKIVWKSSGHGPATDPSQVYHDKLCEAITLASGGRLEVKAVVGGSVAPATQELNAVSEGVLDMCYTCPMYNLDKWPAAGLISARPGGLPGEALRTWFNYGGGAELMNKMMEGFNTITFPGALSPLPDEVFLLSNKVLKTVDDIMGLKIRAAGDGGEVLNMMGAAVVFLPGGELYEAMQRGTIDAFEYSTMASNWDMHFNEIAKYVILSPTRSPSDPQCFFVNEDSWNKLPDDLKRLVQDLNDKWTQAQHEYLVYESILALDKFVEYGCNVYKLPQEVEEALSNTAKKYYTEKAAKEDQVYRDTLESMDAYWEAYSSK